MAMYRYRVPFMNDLRGVVRTKGIRFFSSSGKSKSHQRAIGRVLHHEWIIDGKLVQASSSPSPSPSTDTDTDTVVFLHGLLGNGKNLRTPAKKLTEETGGAVAALMIDLRGHGQSAMSERYAPPHSIHNCSMDVIDTLKALHLTGTNSPVGVVGHSFGGRCALGYHHTLLKQYQQQASTNTNTSTSTSESTIVLPPKHCWILDSCPGKVHSSVANVIAAVSSIQMPISSKKELVRILTNEKNIDLAIASWMTTNLQKAGQGQGQGFDFMFDLDVVKDILENFPQQDMMGMLRDCIEMGKNTSTIHKIIAARNSAWTNDILQELETIRRESDDSSSSSSSPPSLNLVTLDAGHWVHIDDLDGLMKSMTTAF